MELQRTLKNPTQKPENSSRTASVPSASSITPSHSRSRSSSVFTAAILGPVSLATLTMWSLSSPDKTGHEHLFPITNRRDLSKLKGIELHPDTDPGDPVVGDGSADFKLHHGN